MAALAAISGAAVVGRMPGFFRVLRDNGFRSGIAEAVDATRLLETLRLADVREVRESWKALVAGDADQWGRFDKVFDAYWFGRGNKRSGMISGTAPGPAAAAPAQSSGAIGRPGLPDRLERGGAEDGEAAGADIGAGIGRGASRAESLIDVDLRHIAEPDALRRAHAVAADLARRMKHRINRRRRFSRHGGRLDLRRVIHRSIQHGGMPFDLVFRAPRPRPWKLVLLLDVSGSMNPYSSVFMRFVHGMVENFREAEAFVFHTRLVHIGAALRERNATVAMDRLALMTGGWSGGTRIGDCLAAFNRHYAPAMLGSRSLVVILSDGFDTGAPEAVANELAAIKRRARRLVWLNPLAGWRGYEPKAGAMAAALPHIDLFAPAHNLRSLMALEPMLARL